MLFSLLACFALASTASMFVNSWVQRFRWVMAAAVLFALFETFTSIIAVVMPAYISVDIFYPAIAPLNGVFYAWCGVTQFQCDVFVQTQYPGHSDYLFTAGFRAAGFSVTTGQAMVHWEWSFDFSDPSTFLKQLQQYRDTLLDARLSAALTVSPLLFGLNMAGAALGLAAYSPLTRLWMRITMRLSPAAFQIITVGTAIMMVILTTWGAVIAWAYWYHYPFFPGFLYL